jgi:hypothetical protein
VRINGKPVWWSGYGGGMFEDKKHLSHKTFTFLKKALLQGEQRFDSSRDPHDFAEGEWKYMYFQDGDIESFYAY